MKYKLYIRQYDITTNDYKVREEIVETNDIYHEIGKIYSTAFTEIKRIDYEKIDELNQHKKELHDLHNTILELDIMFYDFFRISQNGYYSISECELKEFTQKLEQLKENGIFDLYS